MILHNILIIGLTWLITNLVLGIILSIVSFILGVKAGVKAGSNDELALKIKVKWLKDSDEKLKWYYKMPVSIKWLLLPILLIIDIGIGLYYIFN